MLVRRLATSLGAAGLLLGGSMAGAAHADPAPGATPGTANAGASAKASCFGNASYPGIVCFYEKGDVFKVEDRSGDGLRVQVVWKTSYDRTGACVNTLGAYEVKTCNYDMREGRKLTYRMETRDGGKLHSAWDWRTTTI